MKAFSKSTCSGIEYCCTWTIMNYYLSMFQILKTQIRCHNQYTTFILNSETRISNARATVNETIEIINILIKAFVRSCLYRSNFNSHILIILSQIELESNSIINLIRSYRFWHFKDIGTRYGKLSSKNIQDCDRNCRQEKMIKEIDGNTQSAAHRCITVDTSIYIYSAMSFLSSSFASKQTG